VPAKPKPAAQVVEESVTQDTESLKDDAPSEKKNDRKSAGKKEEKNKKRKAVELVADENDEINEDPSKKHKVVFAKFQRSSKIAEHLRNKKPTKNAKTEQPETSTELHGM
jgi:ATP-dependent RNA helicase DDX51/DBP6